MKKLALVVIATASILSASAAYAGWYDLNRFYHPSCGWFADFYGPVWDCR